MHLFCFLKLLITHFDWFPHHYHVILLTTDVTPFYSSELILNFQDTDSRVLSSLWDGSKDNVNVSGNNYLRSVKIEDWINFSQSRTNTLCTSTLFEYIVRILHHRQTNPMLPWKQTSGTTSGEIPLTQGQKSPASQTHYNHTSLAK